MFLMNSAEECVPWCLYVLKGNIILIKTSFSQQEIILIHVVRDWEHFSKTATPHKFSQIWVCHIATNASQDALALDLLQWGLLFRLCMPGGGTKPRLAFIQVNLSMLKTSRDWLLLGAAQESQRLSKPGWTVPYRIGNEVWMDWSPQLPKTNGWWTEWYLGCQELPEHGNNTLQHRLSNDGKFLVPQKWATQL